MVNHYRDVSDTMKLCSMMDTLTACVPIAEELGIRMNPKALNVTADHVGNFLKYSTLMPLFQREWAPRKTHMPPDKNDQLTTEAGTQDE